MGEILQQFLSALLAFLLGFTGFFGTSSKKDIENVILLIGDGMGEMHLEMTEAMRGISLTMNELPQKGYSKTRSASSSVTDSAAGATAIACGVRTENGMIGLYWDKESGVTRQPGTRPMNLTEVCMENGMKTGVITTDDLSGATPGGFTAHTSSRKNYSDITSQQIQSDIDLIWGKADGTLTEAQVTAAGYTYIDTLSEMNALTGEEKSYGMFTASLYYPYNKNKSTPTLSQMAAKAIDILDSTSEDGFFLMIEGAHIDKKSHDQNEEGAAEALEEFDNTVRVALEFAKQDGHTLVVVTADHETGGVTLNANGEYEMTTGSHTGVNVPLRAYAPDGYEFIGENEAIDNTQISVRIAQALEFPAGSIPCAVFIDS